MEQNKSTWEGNIAIVATLADLKNGIAAIAASASKQQLPIGGVVEEKEMVRHDLEEKILEIGGQLSALADVNGDVNTAAQVEFTLSSLDKLPDDQLEATAKNVASIAALQLGGLDDYGVTQADLTDLNALTARFSNIKAAPRTVIAERVGQTATLPKLIADTTSLLRNRFDKQMIKFRKSNPEFYAAYQSARVIVDRGGSNGAEKPAAAPAAATTAAAVK